MADRLELLGAAFTFENIRTRANTVRTRNKQARFFMELNLEVVFKLAAIATRNHWKVRRFLARL